MLKMKYDNAGTVIKGRVSLPNICAMLPLKIKKDPCSS